MTNNTLNNKLDLVDYIKNTLVKMVAKPIDKLANKNAVNLGNKVDHFGQGLKFAQLVFSPVQGKISDLDRDKFNASVLFYLNSMTVDTDILKDLAKKHGVQFAFIKSYVFNNNKNKAYACNTKDLNKIGQVALDLAKSIKD